MLGGLTLLLACQLAGEVIARALGLPFPGPVIGLVLLLGLLALRGRIDDGLDRAASGLIDNLGLLFVPVGVGVITHLRLIANEWLPIVAALVVSTALGMVATAWLTAWLLKRTPET